ncbi:MAG TPA: RNA degradosome polyphosphate kinase [Sporichthya sp.]|nr:RNA degradosome polyphosphate kinase [Sporichthya sp.]
MRVTQAGEPAAPTLRSVPPPLDLPELPPGAFLDREASWLEFNSRVLELAEDRTLPLLERVRFLAIFASNLDEFFMVRVAGLKRRIAAGVAVTSASGHAPLEILEQVWARSGELAQRASSCFRRDLLVRLAKENIQILRWDDLTDEEQNALHSLFREKVFPVLTPLAVDPAHPFPYISGLSLNLAVVVRNPSTDRENFARVKVPPLLPRFVAASDTRFVPLEDLISAHLQELFPGMIIEAHHAFRVTRNEDFEVEEDDAENLLQAIERELMRRRFGPPVRLEVDASIDEDALDLLVRELGIGPAEVMASPGPLDLSGLHAIADIPRPDLHFPTFVPTTHPHLAAVESAKAADVFAAVRSRDVLLHHPYDSFSTSVQAFIEQAAADPHVLAIKQTLYRTSGDSPIVDALIDAAEAGKQVVCLVELKARFDEQANITWARKLEQAGCHVVYGQVGLKTHCKLALVVREEGDRLRRYCHIGTGNYNPKTARTYEDVGLLTVDPVVAEDVANLFNQLSGYARGTSFRRLLVAPHSVRSGIVTRIEKEIENQLAGRPSRIRIKVNSIVDEVIIDALYRASNAGVPVEILTRGICALRPGVPGMSENITVRSILGRFLEHSRVFWFANGGEPEVWIGSADLMHRNLDRRVEALVRISSADHVRELTEILDLSFSEATAAWHLDHNGTWTRHHLRADGSDLLDLQEHLIKVKARRRSDAD